MILLQTSENGDSKAFWIVFIWAHTSAYKVKEG